MNQPNLPPEKPKPEIEHPNPAAQPEISPSPPNIPEITPPDVKPDSIPAPIGPEITNPSATINEIKTFIEEGTRQLDA